MRKIPICSVTELKNIPTVFYGIDFGDISIMGIPGIRDRLFDEYETIKVIDRDEIKRLRDETGYDNFLYDDIIECMDLTALPDKFVLYVG